MQRRSSNLTRQLLGDPRPTINPWRSPYLGWRVRPLALIRTRSPSASEWADSISVFVSVLTSLDIFDRFHPLNFIVRHPPFDVTVSPLRSRSRPEPAERSGISRRVLVGTVARAPAWACRVNPDANTDVSPPIAAPANAASAAI